MRVHAHEIIYYIYIYIYILYIYLAHIVSLFLVAFPLGSLDTIEKLA